MRCSDLIASHLCEVLPASGAIPPLSRSVAMTEEQVADHAKQSTRPMTDTKVRQAVDRLQHVWLEWREKSEDGTGEVWQLLIHEERNRGILATSHPRRTGLRRCSNLLYNRDGTGAGQQLLIQQGRKWSGQQLVIQEQGHAIDLVHRTDGGAYGRG